MKEQIKRTLRLGLLVLIPLFLAQCMFFGLPTGHGPQGLLFQQTKMGASANDLSIPATRKGEACTNRIMLWIVGFTWGDATIADAARQGQVKRISSVNLEQLNVLTIYSRQCTVVQGDGKEIGPSDASGPVGPGFSDTVILRNGTVHQNVKTIVQGNVINIIKPSGQTITVPKTDVRSIRKGR